MAAKIEGSNGYDPKKLRSYAERIDKIEELIAGETSKMMTACKAHRADIREIYVEAKAFGINVKALRAEMRLRRLDTRKAALVAKLDDEVSDDLELIRDALGDFASTPLGAAASNVIRLNT